MSSSSLKIKDPDRLKISSKLKNVFLYEWPSYKKDEIYNFAYFNHVEPLEETDAYSTILPDKDYVYLKSFFRHKFSDIYFDNQYLTSLLEEVTYNTSPKQIDKTGEEDVKKNLPILHELLFDSDQQKATEWFFEYFNKNTYVAKQLIQQEFYNLMKDESSNEKAIVNLLKILQNFELEEMQPIGPIILMGALNIKSDKVKSVALDVFGHWPNREIYNILKKLDPPSGFLYRIKFDSLLKSFEKRYDVSTKD